MDQQEHDRAKQIMEQHKNELMSYPNVTGVGVGYRVKAGKRGSDICIRVYVIKKYPEKSLKEADILPSSIEGVPVDVIESGIIKAL